MTMIVSFLVLIVTHAMTMVLYLNDAAAGLAVSAALNHALNATRRLQGRVKSRDLSKTANAKVLQPVVSVLPEPSAEDTTFNPECGRLYHTRQATAAAEQKNNRSRVDVGSFLS